MRKAGYDDVISIEHEDPRYDGEEGTQRSLDRPAARPRSVEGSGLSTLIDVARRAGVSKSTVSNVIRGASLVAEPTRQRVERAIADMGYHPNAIARALKARSSSAIGIVVPDLANPFYAELAVSVERAASALGYAVLTAHTECAPTTEEEAGRAFIERRVDGVIIAGISLGSSLPAMLLDREIPVVLASFGEPEDKRLGVIDHDDAAAMEAIVDHLYGLGHRRVAFVSQHLREYGGERRRVGFMKRAGAAGPEPRSSSTTAPPPSSPITTCWRSPPSTGWNAGACACPRTSRSSAMTTCRLPPTAAFG